MARDAVSKRTTRQSTRRQQNLSDQQNQPPPPQHQKQQQQQEPPQSGLDNKCDQRELVNNETKPIEPVLIDVPISDEKKKEIVYKDVQEMLENDLNCAICRETYINPLILNCSHSFCKFCVYHWLNRKPGCPTCRMTVTFQAENLALRNIINRMIQKSSQENQTIRANAVSQRLKDEEQQLKDGVIPKILKPYAPDGHRLVRRGGHYSLRAVGPTDESTPAQGGNANVVISGFPRLDFSEFSPRLGRPARYHPLPSVLQDLSYGDGDDDDDDDDDDMDDDVEIFVNRGDINNLSDYFESDDSEDEDDDYIANDDDDDDGDNDEEDDDEDEDDDDADESDEDDDIHDNERHEDTVDIMSFSDSESDESYVPDLSFREHDSLDTYYVESDEDSVPMNRFSSSSSSSSIASIPTGYHVSDSSSEDDDSVNIVPGRQTDGSAMDTEDEEEGRSRHDSWMRDDDDDDDDDEDGDEDDDDDDDDSFPSLDRSDSDFDSASSPDENSDLDMDSDSESDSDSDR